MRVTNGHAARGHPPFVYLIVLHFSFSCSLDLLLAILYFSLFGYEKRLQHTHTPWKKCRCRGFGGKEGVRQLATLGLRRCIG